MRKYGLGSLGKTPTEDTPPIGPGLISGKLVFNLQPTNQDYSWLTSFKIKKKKKEMIATYCITRAPLIIVWSLDVLSSESCACSFNWWCCPAADKLFCSGRREKSRIPVSMIFHLKCTVTPLYNTKYSLDFKSHFLLSMKLMPTQQKIR